jgi:hypothetical protein
MRVLTAALLLRRAANAEAAGAPAQATADGGCPARPIRNRVGPGISVGIGAIAAAVPEGERELRRESARWSR